MTRGGPLAAVGACVLALAVTLIPVPARAQHTLTGELPSPRGDGPAIVVVAGATGRTGREILSQIERDPRYAVRPLARDPEAAREGSGSRYAWTPADVTRPATLVTALRGARFVICAIGATGRSGPNGPEAVDFGGVRNLVEAAKAEGIEHFVLMSSMGVGSGGGFTGLVLNLISGDALKWKAKGEAALRASGVPYTIVRPGGLTDGERGTTGLAIQQGDEGAGRIARADVAAVMIAALGNPAAQGKTFEVVADEDAERGAWESAFSGLVRDAR